VEIIDAYRQCYIMSIYVLFYGVDQMQISLYRVLWPCAYRMLPNVGQ